MQGSVNHDKNQNVPIYTTKVSCIQSDVCENDNNHRNVNAEKNQVNADASSCSIIPIYDINYSSLDDRFVTAIMHASRKNASSDFENIYAPIIHKWRGQVDFTFLFFPLQHQLMSDSKKINPCHKHSWL